MEFRLNSPTGALVATIEVGNTGGYQIWETRLANTTSVTGIQDLYLVFNGGAGIGNLNWFQFSRDPLPTDTGDIVLGGIYKISNKNSGKVLDVRNSSLQNGARIQQWDFFGSDNQLWRIEASGTDSYKITSVNSNKVLDVVDASIGDRARIQQWEDFGSANQQWQIEPFEDGFFEIISVNSGKALDILRGQTSNGADVIQFGRNASDSQKWTLELINVSSTRQTTQSPDGETKETIQHNNDQVMIYPNPSTDRRFSVRLPASIKQSSNLQLIDISGKLVYSKELTEQDTTIELPSQVKKGIVFLRIEGAEINLSKKLIVN